MTYTNSEIRADLMAVVAKIDAADVPAPTPEPDPVPTPTPAPFPVGNAAALLAATPAAPWRGAGDRGEGADQAVR